MSLRLATTVVMAGLLLAPELHAQTAQRFSIQISALGVRLTGQPNEEIAFGGGGELQVRWNPSAFSIGIGGQTTRHELRDGNVTITFKGGFLEPRYIVTTFGDVVAAYVSGRLMTLDATFDILGNQRSVEGFAVSGGGGLLIRLSDRLNGELGVTVGKEYYDGNAADGATVVSRLGLAIGLG